MTPTNQLVEALRASGVKMTSQRQAICEWLEDNATHPNAAAIYDALRDSVSGLSLATVYNTLTLLHRLHLIHEVIQAPDGSIRYDTNVAPHLNLVCRVCGTIADEQITTEQLELIYNSAISQRFQVREAAITLHGLCHECRVTQGLLP